MTLQIATNVAAINAQRNLANTTLKMGKVLEKLSSGYRINRAADDAAGLAISEKMRAQIRGNAQAVRNAQDGISMLQTAEGALDEVHSILQRMRELSVQAANGTYADGSAERTSIGQEINQLKQEIDRIATSTKFNGQNLLTGTLTGTLGGATGTDLIVGDQLTTTAVAAVTKVEVAGAKAQTYTFTSGGAGSLTLTGADGSAQTLSGITNLAANETRTLNFSNLGVSITIQANASGKAVADLITDLTAAADDTIVVTGSGAASLQVGANSGDSLAISFVNMQTGQLGAGSDLSTLIADDTNVSTQAKASTLISELDGAISDVNAQRGTFGAAQNRLEHTIRSLSVAVENLSAAESRIRDADVADLSSRMVSNQILQQAGISVLAQANQAPQAALALLRN
ncbi:MAG: flagellin [Dehalococcoidia bacterium]|nr:flagellin [Dehalococcoidia bacterium]